MEEELIKVTEESDGTLTIEWDETDPRCHMLNLMTEQDFIDLFMARCQQALDEM